MNHEERKAAHLRQVELLEQLHAMPLPTPPAADSEATSSEVEGGVGRATEGVSVDGLQPEAQLLRREPELLEGAGRDADRAPEEIARIQQSLKEVE
jgi:hypothetical protein